MLSKEPQLAPAPVIVGYLAVFQRTLVAIENYTRDGDKPGMLLGGWLADALHNVPGMLWHCDPDGWHNPTQMNAWMQTFPDSIAQRAAPARIIADSRRIVSAEGAAHELGLREDLADLELAPLPKMRHYLNRLYDACLWMRLMRNYGTKPFTTSVMPKNTSDAIPAAATGQPHLRRCYTPWVGLERGWTADAQTQADFNGRMATILKTAPQGLVRWGEFDEVAWIRAAQDVAADLPDDHRQWSTIFVTPKVS